MTKITYIEYNGISHTVEVGNGLAVMEGAVQNKITGIDDSFKKLMDGEIDPDEYINSAEISSSQLNSLVIELTNSGATQEWSESYVNYIGALKKLNDKITETIVIANLIDDNNSNSIHEILAKIKQLETESLDFTKKSDNSRP